MAPGRGSSGGREEEQARCADGWAMFCLKGQFRSWEDDIPPPRPCLGSRARTDPEAAGSFCTTIPSQNPQPGMLPEERGKVSPYTRSKGEIQPRILTAKFAEKGCAHTATANTNSHPQTNPDHAGALHIPHFPLLPLLPPPLLLAFMPMSALEKNLILRGDDATRRREGGGQQGGRGSKRHI